MSGSSRWGFGGIPTGPEVKKLYDTFGIPEKGSSISYEDIEAVLGRNRERDTRFHTVLDAWRKDLFKNHNLVTEAVGDGIRVLTEEERLDHTHSRLRRGVRQIGKALHIAGTTDRNQLSADGQKKCDKQLEVARRTLESFRSEMKKTPPQIPAVVSIKTKKVNSGSN